MCDCQQEEKEEVASRPAAAAEKEVVRGLLSRAFHQPPRSVSLHNLLDLQPETSASQMVRPSTNCYSHARIYCRS